MIYVRELFSVDTFVNLIRYNMCLDTSKPGSAKGHFPRFKTTIRCNNKSRIAQDLWRSENDALHSRKNKKRMSLENWQRMYFCLEYGFLQAQMQGLNGTYMVGTSTFLEWEQFFFHLEDSAHSISAHSIAAHSISAKALFKEKDITRKMARNAIQHGRWLLTEHA